MDVKNGITDTKSFREARDYLGLSQSKLANALKVSTSTIHKIEAGTIPVQRRHEIEMIKLVNALNASLGQRQTPRQYIPMTPEEKVERREAVRLAQIAAAVKRRNMRDLVALQAALTTLRGDREAMVQHIRNTLATTGNGAHILAYVSHIRDNTPHEPTEAEAAAGVAP